MKYIYIVAVQPNSYIWEKVSQEGYDTLQKAQAFIESRSDNPIKFDDFKYQGTTNTYRIYEINVK